MSDRRLTWDWMRGFGGFLWGEEETELDIRKRETDTRTAWNGRMSGSSVVDVVVVNYSSEEAREAHAARAMQGRERERQAENM